MNAALGLKTGTNLRVIGATGSKSKPQRVADASLLEKVVESSSHSEIQFRVIDAITVYRILLEMRDSLSSAQKKICDMAIDEVEKSFSIYLDSGDLPARTFGIKDIIGVVK